MHCSETVKMLKLILFILSLFFLSSRGSKIEDYTSANLKLTYTNSNNKIIHKTYTRTGKYIGNFSESFSGNIIHINSPIEEHTACALPLTVNNSNLTKPWIALIKAGNCTINIKLKNLQSLHPTAVVMYSTKNASTIVTLERLTKNKNKLTPQERRINVVYMKKLFGEKILRLLENHTVYGRITKVSPKKRTTTSAKRSHIGRRKHKSHIVQAIVDNITKRRSKSRN